MLGKKNLVQPLFITLNLNEFVPADHRLRKIDKILDLSFIRDLTRDKYCPDNGRASIDPVVFFKIQIIKYLFGIPSDRQLCEEIHVNLAYRWFLRYSLEDKVPDHSALTRIRDRLGEDLFKDVFERIVNQCKKAGLVRGKQMVTDATLIEADAAIDSVSKREDADKDVAETAKGEEFEGKRVSIRTHESATDPDASVVYRSGKKLHLYYKSHVTIDGHSRVMTDCHITTGSTHECTMFQERAAAQMKTFDLTPSEWLNDKGYGHGPIYEFLKSRKITPYIPLRDNKLGNGKDAPTKDFKYNRKENIYVCPAGHKMYPHAPTPSFTRYVTKNKECLTCPLRATCMEGMSKTRSSKYVNRSTYQDVFESLHRRQKTKHFKYKRKSSLYPAFQK
jgi:transposase